MVKKYKSFFETNTIKIVFAISDKNIYKIDTILKSLTKSFNYIRTSDGITLNASFSNNKDKKTFINKISKINKNYLKNI